ISSTDPEYRMPPADFPKPLDTEEIQVLSQWVEAGVPWENHWAFEPLQASDPPIVSRKRWPRNSIDHFVLEAQEKNGLSPAAEADKRTLLRRLTFDLHGLPPTPDELEDFLADKSEEAYERVVDRLLASPRYGERWARHWLDVAHYGETHGYDKDQRRPNAWPYRDYVISALNSDIPYDRFVEEQIAGDVLYPEDPNATVALGFLAAGPWDLVGHVEVKNGTTDKRIVRNLDRDDMVATTIGTFTSMTVQCARCHDHKFDPISQKDYYSLQAVFAGVDRVDRPYDEDPALHLKRVNLKKEEENLEDQLATLSARLSSADSASLVALINEQVSVQRAIQGARVPGSPSNGYQSVIEEKSGIEKWVAVDLGEKKNIDEIRLVPAHPRDGIPVPGYGFPWRFKIEGSLDATFSSPMLLADFTEEAYSQRTDTPYVLSLTDIEAQYIRVTATELWKGRGSAYFFALSELQVFSKGQNLAFKKPVRALDSHEEGRWSMPALVDGYNSSRGIEKGLETPASRKAVSEKEAQLNVLRMKEKTLRRKLLSKDEQSALEEILKELNALQDTLEALPKPSQVYAVNNDFNNWGRFVASEKPRLIHLLNRGDTEQPLEQMHPGTLSSLPDLPARFALPEAHDEGLRRAALATWITDKDNVLTWRSIVNRVWHYHFGQGLVSTPNDFGKMGAIPSHPALLDWLAFEFVEQGKSLKWLHRLIVTSATYRQASAHNEKYAQVDGGNKYLWRGNRRQLEAEALRDAVLSVSGKLNLTMGGPGFDTFRYEDDHSPRYLYADYNPSDPASFRRAIYRSVIRSVPDPFMTTLDCADPSQSVPVRNETVTALQALAALNNPFMVQQAAFLSARLENEGGDLEHQIKTAYQLALLRSPSKDEQATLTAYAAEHGLAAASRLIFAMNEFLYVD
ncbi:MAG: DUF1553 domain-containing protein, partial [Rhodothermales bacterium]